MTPPDTNLNQQQRRHWGPLAGIGLVVVIALGAFFFWRADDGATAPEPDTAEEAVSPEDIREGDVDVPDNLPVEEVEPGDPDTILDVAE